MYIRVPKTYIGILLQVGTVAKPSVRQLQSYKDFLLWFPE